MATQKETQEIPTQGTETQKRSPRMQSRLVVLSFVLLLLIGVVAYIITNNTAIGHFLHKVNDVLMPVLIGLVLAYLSNPVLRFFEYVIFRRLIKKHPKLCRALSLLLTAVSLILLVFLTFLLIIPELINSIKDFLGNWGNYVDSSVADINATLSRWMQRFSDEAQETEYLNAREIKRYISNLLGSSKNFFEGIGGKLLGVHSMEDLVGKGFSVLSAIIGALADLVLGVIIGFYLLASKEKRYAQIMKLRRAFLSEKTNRRITEICTLVNDSFGGFIRAKLLDSLLIGIGTYIIFQIFHISDYNILLAAFIGVTNVIPVFGPFIGAIPTGVIVLITNPQKIWLFILLVIIIQQFDGNVLGPHLIGNSTGISPFCIITAITIMGGFFGVTGMVLAVPTFAVIITLIKDAAEKRLAVKGLPTDLGEYYDKNTLVSAEEDLQRKKTVLRNLGDKIYNGLSAPFRKLKKNKQSEEHKNE